MGAREIYLRRFPKLAGELKAAATLEGARNAFLRFIRECEERLGWTIGTQMPALQYYTALTCSRALRYIAIPRNEILADTSAVDLIRRSLKGEDCASEAFWQDILHLTLGACGKADIYKGVATPHFLKLEGRAAGRTRSRELNKLAAEIEKAMDRFPSGLEPEIIERREHNMRRIRKFFGASERDWNSHEWQTEHIIRDADTLGRLITLTAAERKSIAAAKAARLPFAVTPYYVMLMDKRASRERDHAVRAQVIPPPDYVEHMRLAKRAKSCELDFMGEADTSPIELVTRRYPQIAIFKPFNTCAQICVYCQRNWEIEDAMTASALAPAKPMRRALNWFKKQTLIEEVLITGGDPMMMPDTKLEKILREFSKMRHIRRIRIGTRTPVVMPMRFTRNVLDILERYHTDDQQIAIVTHFEHPYEVTPEAHEATWKISRLGMSIYNQEVFTIENSRKFETAALRRALKQIAIDPYYVFNTKGKTETEFYRVPIARLLQERKEEARLTPGTVRTDEPVFNVPRLGKNHLRAGQDHALIGLCADGSRVYEMMPWEKNLYPSPTYVYKDMPIHDYLVRLEQRGENLDDYRKIWFYL